MSVALPPPRSARSARAMSQPEQARLILLATSAIICGVLAAWLLLWLLLHKPGSIAAGWGAPGGAGVPVLPFQVEDASAFGRGLGGKPAVPLKDVRRAVADAAAVGGREPLVLYLSVPGIDLDGAAMLLASGASDFAAGRFEGAGLVSAADLIEALSARPDRYVLLILDAAQIGTDRDLGVFGNGFVWRLERWLEEKTPPRLVVLSSCAPGQVSCTNEATRRSVFGECVARGLAGGAAGWDGSGRVTVQGLARFVAHHVERWSQDHRGVRQTPVLLGARDLDFPLRQTGAAAGAATPAGTPSEPDAEPSKAADEATEALDKAWSERDALEVIAPYRHTPMLWRRYLDGLLRVERLHRAGRVEESQAELAALGGLAARIRAWSAGFPHPQAWTLAAGRSSADPKARQEAEAAAGVLKRVVADLTGRSARDQSDATPAAAAAEEPAKGVEKTEAAKGEAAPNRPARKEADLAPLLAGGRGRVPRFVEAQPVVRAATFRELPGAPAWEGRRAEGLEAAVELRGRAEALGQDGRSAAAESPERARAEAARREAEDSLFSTEPDDVAEAVERFGQAAAQYEQAAGAANVRGRALDLIARMCVELPELAAWRGRSGSSTDLGDLTRPIAAAEELARALREGDEAGLASTLNRAEEAYNALRGEFRRRVELAAAPGSSARWDEVDALLRVPLIPAKERAELRRRAASAALNPAIEVDAPAPSAAGTTEADPDPWFWSAALAGGLAECGVLELGGAAHAEVDALRGLLEGARAGRDRPEAAFEALAKFNEGVRATRRRLRETAGSAASGPDRNQDDAAIERALAAAHSAGLALPSAAFRAVGEEASPEWQLGRFRRYAVIRGLGVRLVADFAAEHAQAVLTDARSLLDTRAVRADLDEARKVARARLVVSPTPAGGVTIAREDARLSLRVAGEGPVPRGRAVPMVLFDPDRPIEVGAEEAGEEDASPVLVPVASGEPATRAFVLRRTEFTDEDASLEVRPIAFYRGRRFEAEVVPVAVRQAEEAVSVGLEDPMPDAAKRRFGDQFEDHPTRGYLRFGASLDYRLVLTNRTNGDLKVIVRAGLDGQTPESDSLVLKPGVPTRIENLMGRIQAVEAPPTDPKAGPNGPMPEPGDDEVFVGRPRILTVEVEEDAPSRRPLALRRRFEFHQLAITEYAWVVAQFDTTKGDMVVDVHHLRSDPVRGPLIDVAATIGGQRWEMKQGEGLLRGKYYHFWKNYGPDPTLWPEKIPWSVDIGRKTRAAEGVTEVLQGKPPAPAPGGAPASGPKL